MVFIMFHEGRGTVAPLKSVINPKLISNVTSTERTKEVTSALKTGGEESKQRVNPTPNPYDETIQYKPERKPARYAKQIMSTPAISITTEDSLTHCLKLFRERRFRHLPVVDTDGKIVGIVSDRDVLIYNKNDRRNTPRFDKNAIKNLMTPSVLTATGDSEIRLIASAMCENKVGAIPIVDENHCVLGIVTRGDILSQLINQAPMDIWM